MRAATEGSLPPVMPQGNLVEVLGREVRQESPGELMVESTPSGQRRPPCKTNKEESDEAADAAALTYLLTYCRMHTKFTEPCTRPNTGDATTIGDRWKRSKSTMQHKQKKDVQWEPWQSPVKMDTTTVKIAKPINPDAVRTLLALQEQATSTGTPKSNAKSNEKSEPTKAAPPATGKRKWESESENEESEEPEEDEGGDEEEEDDSDASDEGNRPNNSSQRNQVVVCPIPGRGH